MDVLRLNIKLAFGDVAEKWGVETDSRKYFSNKYFQIMNAIDVMETVTDSYVLCAVYDQIEKDMKEMEQIYKAYMEMDSIDKKIAEWTKTK